MAVDELQILDDVFGYIAHNVPFRVERISALQVPGVAVLEHFSVPFQVLEGLPHPIDDRSGGEVDFSDTLDQISNRKDLALHNVVCECQEPLLRALLHELQLF